ncbi:hypothetical protein M1B34_13310 [Pseudomonas sp. MAFF 302030]|uniref:Uncharacterized protein n=1 Tax=Pseudomonas morbosilactucae TaxID=2938197 RepID=A0A9X1YV65_9PSED|nr:hypothetical protein [Pseudomonas morbosilactucae]MCK9798675.1 hypothetical protein [Pseudomonas morbosilactucae]
MNVNNLQLPEAYTALASKHQASGGFCNLRLAGEHDAFGNFLETELAQIYIDEFELAAKTKQLNEYFALDGCYGDSAIESSHPGAIADITDFTKIVCFGMAADGSQFCFDFRNDKAARPLSGGMMITGARFQMILRSLFLCFYNNIFIWWLSFWGGGGISTV